MSWQVPFYLWLYGLIDLALQHRHANHTISLAVGSTIACVLIRAIWPPAQDEAA